MTRQIHLPPPYRVNHQPRRYIMSTTTQSNEAVEAMNKSTEIMTLPNGDSMLFSEVALIRTVFSGKGAIHPGVQVSRRAHGLPGSCGRWDPGESVSVRVLAALTCSSLRPLRCSAAICSPTKEICREM